MNIPKKLWTRKIPQTVNTSGNIIEKLISRKDYSKMLCCYVMRKLSIQLDRFHQKFNTGLTLPISVGGEYKVI